MSFSFLTDEQFLNKEIQRKPRRMYGYIGKQDGTVWSDNRPNRVWVRIGSLTGPEQSVENAKKLAGNTPGTPVELMEIDGAPGSFRVEGFAESAPLSVIAANTGAAAQQYGGSDVMINDLRANKQLSIHQTNPSSLSVVMNAGTIYEGSTRHDLLTKTSSAVTAPAAGLARWDVVSVDPFDWSLTITTGTPFNKNIPASGVKPDFPTDKIPVGDYRIDDTTTELKDGRNISPAPPYFAVSQGLITPVSASALTSGPGVYPVNNDTQLVTVTLSAADNVTGRRILVVDKGLNADTLNIKLNTEDGALINEQAEQIITVAGGYIGVYSDGSNWTIIVENPPEFFTRSATLPYTASQNAPKLDIDIHGDFQLLGTPDQPLDSGTPIDTFTGCGKLVIVAKTGTLPTGPAIITVTGDTIDRDTGVLTAGDTEDVEINALATDNSYDDAHGNEVHEILALITTKWFQGAISVSTVNVELLLTEVDLYICAFYQFNGLPDIKLTRLGFTAKPTNINAQMTIYEYVVRVAGSVVNITPVATVEILSSEIVAGSIDLPFRRDDSIESEPIDGGEEGIFINMFPRPTPQTYWQDINLKVEYTSTEPLFREALPPAMLLGVFGRSEFSITANLGE